MGPQYLLRCFALFGAVAATSINVPLSQLSFSGAWTSTFDPNCGPVMQTTTLGDSFSFKFTGSGYAFTTPVPPNTSGRLTMSLTGYNDGPFGFIQSPTPACQWGWVWSMPFREYVVTVRLARGSYFAVSSFSYTVDPESLTYLSDVAASASLIGQGVQSASDSAVLASVTSSLDIQAGETISSFSVAATSFASLASDQSSLAAAASASAEAVAAHYHHLSPAQRNGLIIGLVLGLAILAVLAYLLYLRLRPRPEESIHSGANPSMDEQSATGPGMLHPAIVPRRRSSGSSQLQATPYEGRLSAIERGHAVSPSQDSEGGRKQYALSGSTTLENDD